MIIITTTIIISNPNQQVNQDLNGLRLVKM